MAGTGLIHSSATAGGAGLLGGAMYCTGCCVMRVTLQQAVGGSGNKQWLRRLDYFLEKSRIVEAYLKRVKWWWWWWGRQSGGAGGIGGKAGCPCSALKKTKKKREI